VDAQICCGSRFATTIVEVRRRRQNGRKTCD
jgi:hypothetical protein